LKTRLKIGSAALLLLLLAEATPQAVLAQPVKQDSAVPAAEIPPYLTAAINSADRPATDKEKDGSRQPEQMMAFFGIKPGMKVADIWAAGGYTTEILARIVGPTGKVYSQNVEFPEKFKDAAKVWKARPNEPGLSNVVEVTKPFDSPDFPGVPPNTLDAAIINLNYHDLIARGFDTVKFNEAVYQALKPGGIFGTVDNSAQAGSGARDVNTLHRIDEKLEIEQIEKAGFKLIVESNVHRNPNDPRTQPFWKMDHKQDRFMLKFVKPT
jgi:predicted methyltransferase